MDSTLGGGELRVYRARRRVSSHTPCSADVAPKGRGRSSGRDRFLSAAPCCPRIKVHWHECLTRNLMPEGIGREGGAEQRTKMCTTPGQWLAHPARRAGTTRGDVMGDVKGSASGAIGLEQVVSEFWHIYSHGTPLQVLHLLMPCPCLEVRMGQRFLGAALVRRLVPLGSGDNCSKGEEGRCKGKTLRLLLCFSSRGQTRMG